MEGGGLKEKCFEAFCVAGGRGSCTSVDAEKGHWGTKGVCFLCLYWRSSFLQCGVGGDAG